MNADRSAGSAEFAAALVDVPTRSPRCAKVSRDPRPRTLSSVASRCRRPWIWWSVSHRAPQLGHPNRHTTHELQIACDRRRHRLDRGYSSRSRLPAAGDRRLADSGTSTPRRHRRYPRAHGDQQPVVSTCHQHNTNERDEDPDDRRTHSISPGGSLAPPHTNRRRQRARNPPDFSKNGPEPRATATDLEQPNHDTARRHQVQAVRSARRVVQLCNLTRPRSARRGVSASRTTPSGVETRGAFNAQEIVRGCPFVTRPFDGSPKPSTIPTYPRRRHRKRLPACQRRGAGVVGPSRGPRSRGGGSCPCLACR